MSAIPDNFLITYPKDFDERAEFEAVSRGYIADVVVQTEDGERYQLFFYDPVRLAQDLEAYVQCGREYSAEPGMVVIPSATKVAVEKAVRGLIQDGFFDHLRPIQECDASDENHARRTNPPAPAHR